MPRTMTCAVLLVVFNIAWPADASAQDEAARLKLLSQAADLHFRLRDLEKAKKQDEVKALLPQFTAAVQEAATHLPQITPEQAAKAKAYQKLTLNAGKTRLDGFRFQVPEGKGGWNMDWEFVIPKDAGAVTWGITAREGTVDGFKTFDFKADYAEKGADLPKENKRITQKLTGGKLKSGSEYVIWFAIDGDKPVDAHVRIGLTPVSK